jgi:hypothetical protein
VQDLLGVFHYQKEEKAEMKSNSDSSRCRYITLNLDGFSEIAAIMDSSPSNTNAGPVILPNNG